MTEAQPRRYLDNDGPMLQLNESPKDIIVTNLTKLISDHRPSASDVFREESFGLFAGPTSIAYVLFKLSQPGTGYDELLVNGSTLRQWAGEYLNCAREAPKSDNLELTDNPGHQGVLFETPCRLALETALFQNESALGKFLELLPGVLDETKKGTINEHIYGRTGYLYLLRLIQKYWPEAPIPAGTTNKIVDVVMRDGPLEWKFVDRYYLGAGHGWINVITQILLTDKSYAAACKPMLAQILDEQVTDPENPNYGNWDGFLTNENTPPERYMIQWGHGAPGIVISLLSIRPAYEQNDPDFVARIDEAIRKSQDVIWKQGLIKKESCLCHGAAGNMLALTGAKQREHFMAHSTEDMVQRAIEDGSVEASGMNIGLFRGLVGRIWGFYMFEKGGFEYAGYNDL